nr:hypothetical protein [Angustibacter aerolatus]
MLLLTAAAGIRDRVEGLGLGADDYLTKPFAFAEPGCPGAGARSSLGAGRRTAAGGRRAHHGRAAPRGAPRRRACCRCRPRSSRCCTC